MCETKVCKKCGKELPTTEFYPSKAEKDGLQVYCKDCGRDYQRARKAKLKANAFSFREAEKPKPETINIDGRTLIKVRTSLSDYTPRELLEELKRRGYVWDKMYIKQFVSYDNI